jgi:uncharacterized protein YwqG
MDMLWASSARVRVRLVDQCLVRGGETINAVIGGQAALVRLARRELPAAIADVWISLLRPSFLLREAHDHERVVGQLGGIPVLPDGMGWPQHPDGRGPLTFIAEIDCGQLPSSTLSLPQSGRLSFFLWDDLAPGSRHLDAYRVIYVPSRTPVSEREPPEGCAEYDLVELTGEVRATGPTRGTAVFREAVAELGEDGRAFLDYWGDWEARSFHQGLRDLSPQPRHRIGGYALAVHGDPGLRVAWEQLAGDKVFGRVPDYVVHREALRWRLLAQFDSDARAGMKWGSDLAGLYWLIRTGDLAARKFEAAALDHQRSA